MTTHTTTIAPFAMPTMETRAAPKATQPNHTTSSKLIFDDIPSCIEAFRNGEFLIVLDDDSRENEGDLIIAAKALTPARCAFMIRHTSGYLCAPLTAQRAAHFNLSHMVTPSEASDPHGTAYTVAVDARGAGTGISAADRSATCRVLGGVEAGSADLRRPGHVLPLIAREGGVRVRRGHTEATWEFCRLAGIAPEVGVIGEMIIDGEYVGGGQPDEQGRMRAEMMDSGMMRAPDCLEFGRRWGIKCCTIEDLVRYVEETEGRLLI